MLSNLGRRLVINRLSIAYFDHVVEFLFQNVTHHVKLLGIGLQMLISEVIIII